MCHIFVLIQPIEVDCSEFTGQSLCRVFNMLGITRAIKEVTEAAEAASMWLRMRRRQI